MLILFSSAIKLDFRENRELILHRPICKINTVISCSTSVLVKISRELLEIYRPVTEEEVLMKKINQVGVWGISMRLQLVWQTNCLLCVDGCRWLPLDELQTLFCHHLFCLSLKIAFLTCVQGRVYMMGRGGAAPNEIWLATPGSPLDPPLLTLNVKVDAVCSFYTTKVNENGLKCKKKCNLINLLWLSDITTDKTQLKLFFCDLQFST